MKTVARLSAEDRSDLFRNTANRMQMSRGGTLFSAAADLLMMQEGERDCRRSMAAEECCFIHAVRV